MSSTVLWKDNDNLVPAFEVVCKALQDPGSLRKGKKNVSIIKFGNLNKLASDVYSNLLRNYPKYDGLDSNVSWQSLAVDDDSPEGSMRFVEDPNLFNVMITRARHVEEEARKCSRDGAEAKAVLEEAEANRR